MGFRGKQIATLTLVAAAVALATSLMNTVAMTRIAVQQTRDRTEETAETLYHLAREAIRNSAGQDLQTALASAPALRTYAQAVVGYSEITLYLTIVDETERIVFHSDPLQEGGQLRPAETLKEFTERPALSQLWLMTRGHRALSIDLPFTLAGEEPAGAVRVAFSTLLLKRRIQGAMAMNAALAASVVLVVFLASFYFANRLLAPLDMLRRELRRIDPGDDGPPLDLRSREDVDRVAEFFASVSRQLADDRPQKAGGSTWLETMLAGLDEAVFVVNREGQIVSLNPSASMVLGRESGQLLDRSVDDVLAESSPLLALIHESLERGTAPGPQTLDLMAGEGQRPYTVTAQVLSESGRVTGVMITGRDVEKLARLGSHLSYTQKLSALGQLTSGISHEIKNPLNAMVLHVSLLRGKVGNDSVQEHLEVLEREIRGLERVIDGFLKFTRPDKLKLEAVALDDVLDEALPLVSSLAEQNGVHMERKLSAALRPVYGDRELLKQAFSNLLRNACEAMPAGGELRVGAGRSGQGSVEVVVEDTGVGIATDAIPKVFNLYYTTKSEGSGIGLSLTYRIVQLHGGEIAVDSKLDRGTRFTVSLPELDA